MLNPRKCSQYDPFSSTIHDTGTLAPARLDQSEERDVDKHLNLATLTLHLVGHCLVDVGLQREKVYR